MKKDRIYNAMVELAKMSRSYEEFYSRVMIELGQFRLGDVLIILKGLGCIDLQEFYELINDDDDCIACVCV